MSRGIPCMNIEWHCLPSMVLPCAGSPTQKFAIKVADSISRRITTFVLSSICCVGLHTYINECFSTYTEREKRGQYIIYVYMFKYMHHSITISPPLEPCQLSPPLFKSKLWLRLIPQNLLAKKSAKAMARVFEEYRCAGMCKSFSNISTRTHDGGENASL